MWSRSKFNQDLLTAYDNGKEVLMEEINKKLINKSTGFYEFTKRHKSKVVKADRKLIQKLFNATRANRNVDMEEILSHELHPWQKLMEKWTPLLSQTILSVLAADIQTPYLHQVNHQCQHVFSLMHMQWFKPLENQASQII